MTIEIRQLFEGWKAFLQQKSLSPDQLRVAERRLESCSNCQYAKKWKAREIVGWIWDALTNKNKPVKEKKFQGFLCSICSCPLDIKVLSPSSKCSLPNYENKDYPHKERWGYVFFDEAGKLTTPDNVFITVSTSEPESML